MKLSAFFALALVCLTATARAVPVTVTVVGPDDKPLADAQLSVIEAPLTSTEENARAAREVTGENGLFRFERDSEFVVGKPDFNAPETLTKSAYLWARVAAPGMTTETRLIRQSDTTIHLQAGRVWGGVVLDADEKPVAGVTIEINSWSVGTREIFNPFEDDTTEQAGFSGYGTEWKLRTQTDAQGRWQFDALPARGRASLLLSDTRFISKVVDVSIGPLDAPPLFARAGATITGVLVTPAGKPIEGALVSAGYGDAVSPKTGADGRFTLTGVEAGETSLRDYSNAIFTPGDKSVTDTGYILSPLERVTAVAGKITDIGRWQAKAGVKVSAQIVDAATKKPLESVNLYFWSGGGGFQSDAQGRIETRALTDDWNDDPYVGSINKEGYISAQIARPKLDKDAQTVDLGTVEMERGTTLKGKVRIEGETDNPRFLPSIILQNPTDGNVGFLNTQDKTGEFASEAMKPGTYKVSLATNRSDENNGFELVSPTTIKVPALPKAGAPAPEVAPLEIVVKRVGDAPTLLGQISGRVTDSEGKGVGGAIVSARLTSNNRSTMATALSENDGSFVVEKASYLGDFGATSVDVTGIERPGYGWASAPTVETKGGATTIGNLTLKKLGVIFAGRVLEEAGVGAGGAWVGVIEARDFEPVQSAPDGSFELRDVPLDKFTLIAARDAAWTRIEANSKASGVTLKLQTPAPPDRETLANQALEGDTRYLNLSEYWDILGVARLQALVARSDRFTISFALELAERDPQEFLRRAPTFLENATDDVRAQLEPQLFLARAASDKADDRAAAQQWLAEQKSAKRAISADSVRQLLALAQIADALKQPAETASWLDYAAAINAQLGAAGGNAETGRAAARLGYDAARTFIEEAKPAAEFAFWRGASATLAKRGDFAGAKAALSRMQELAKTPALVEADKGEPWNGPTRTIKTITQNMAGALAKTDAAGALELLPTNINSWERGRLLLTIADRAVAARSAPIAQRALHEVFQSDNLSDGDYALAASLAQQLDPQLGAELWAEARKRLVPDKDWQMRGDSPASIGMWAFYHARLDAGLSRVLIEREWNWRLPAAVKEKDDKYSSAVQYLATLVLGMGAVDPARALQMREVANAQTGKNGAVKADLQLAAAILASDAQRARLGAEMGY